MNVCSKHSCAVDGSFWLLYFTCRNCGAISTIDRDEYRALVLTSSDALPRETP